METKGKIWVALDTEKDKALEMAKALGEAKLPVIAGSKANRLIDQEVFRKDGEVKLFEKLSEYGIPLWADLKLNDVPRTVAGRIEPYVQSGLVAYITVMAKGGVDMMIAAVKAGGAKTQIIAVTELTSLTEEEIHLLSGQPAKASVINLARSAVLAGVKYLVCSGQELTVIRKRPELNALKIFVPAVAPDWAPKPPSDQKRTMSVVEALKGGAEAVVIGSLFAESEDPVEVAIKTAEEIAAAA